MVESIGRKEESARSNRPRRKERIMAYFSNGTEGDLYLEQYCLNCANWRDLGDGRGHGCPVWDVHLLHAYDECETGSNAEAILNTLIPTDAETGFASECSMFLKKETE